MSDIKENTKEYIDFLTKGTNAQYELVGNHKNYLFTLKHKEHDQFLIYSGVEDKSWRFTREELESVFKGMKL